MMPPTPSYLCSSLLAFVLHQLDSRFPFPLPPPSTNQCEPAKGLCNCQRVKDLLCPQEEGVLTSGFHTGKVQPQPQCRRVSREKSWNVSLEVYMLPKKCQVVHMPPIYPVKCHFILFFAYFYCCSSTLVSIFTLPWSPTPTISASHPRTYPLWLFPCVLCTYSLMDFSLFPPIIPLPSGYCQFVLYFNVSCYILLACLFCWLGSTGRWDHMVFVFHSLAYFT